MTDAFDAKLEREIAELEQIASELRAQLHRHRLQTALCDMRGKSKLVRMQEEMRERHG